MPIERAFSFAELLSLARAGSAWRFDASGVLAEVAANLPRLDHNPATLQPRGLLLEEAATNVVLDPRREGAVAGSSGTAPPAWGFVDTTGAFGLTRTISLGVEDGLPFVDFRWTGTATSSGNLQHFTLSPDQAASVGQTWTYAPYCVVFGPALPSNPRARLIELPSFAATETAFAAGAVGLRLSRRAVTRTLTDAAASAVRVNIWVSVSSGVTYDFTVRVAAPQLWQSALQFSPSFPPAGTPGASTRAADDFAFLDLGAFYNAAGGTFVMDWTPGQATSPGNRGLLMLDDGTANNRLRLFMTAASTAPRLQVTSDGVNVVPGTSAGAVTALARSTLRFSYGPAGYLLSVDGGAPVAVAGALPLNVSRCILGRSAPASEYLNGWLGPRLDYFPVQYTDTPAADGLTIRSR